MFLLALLVTYESPRWLIVVGRVDEGKTVIEAVLQSPVLLKSDPPPVFRTVPARIVVSMEEHGDDVKSSFADRLQLLLSVRLRLVLFCALTAMIAVNGVSYGWGIWAPEILRWLAGTGETPYTLLMWGEVTGVLGVLAAAPTLEWAGRKWVLGLSCAFFALGLAALPNVRGQIIFIAAWFLWVTFINSFMWAAAKVYAAEALPTDVRGTGNAIAGIGGRASGMILPVLVGLILQGELEGTGLAVLGGPVHLALYLVALVSCLGTLAAWLIPVETACLKLSDV
eukprot:gnl/TRDRNA2_/TRDRNA2_135367_c1_seq1.p1 gnl/TRDRNA2_/TRDRNA2_135367_c1~~gnl/TRDRNA2_/TRDRNA2_135367_c1_seq1.p1  ORF type:complete len:311 (+),score=36.37 gnl/TRDRNA2_/TRDRNA2_135367_c1_seq1:90-935(+)